MLLQKDLRLPYWLTLRISAYHWLNCSDLPEGPGKTGSPRKGRLEKNIREHLKNGEGKLEKEQRRAAEGKELQR